MVTAATHTMDLNNFRPMLLSERPLGFDVLGWIYEIKLDGYRVTAMFGDGKCKLRTRGGADCTRWFPEVASSLAKVEGGLYITDGEICVFDDLGRSDFDRLQKRAVRRRWVEGGDPVGYAVFDLLVHQGRDITQDPLGARKVLLSALLRVVPDGVIVVRHFEIGTERLFREGVMGLDLEGLVAKKLNSTYQPGIRSKDWVKIKRKGAVPAERFKHAER